jgi:hypothetical protein
VRLLDFTLLSVAALTTSCSALFTLDDEQCSTTDDCRSRQGAFADSFCFEGYCKSVGQTTGCSSNAQCGGTELCLDQECITITNTACPMVFGEANLRAESPIVFAILAPFNTAPLGVLEIQNYKLAFDEFAQELPGGPGGKHPFAALLCNKDDATASTHAIEKVGVSSVLAQLESDEIVASFQSSGKQQGVFYLTPHDADSSVTVIPDDSLIWSMLGSSTDLAPVYKPLMARVEAHLALPQPVKVALVENDELFELDLANAISNTMTIGGMPANQSPGFSRHAIAASDPSKAQQVVAKLLTEIQPDVIISAAAEEFVTNVLWPVEQAWDAVVGTQHPFYILSLENLFSGSLYAKIDAKPELRTRITGVNYATAKDQTLLDAYLQRFKKAYPETPDYDSSENYYDAMYFLLYAYAAAGDVGTYTGADVSRGMKRLLSGQRVDVGPEGIPAGVAYLQVPNSQIALYGTLGPPDFDAGTGARISEGSVWCVADTGEPLSDVLRLDDGGELVGDFPCFDF